MTGVLPDSRATNLAVVAVLWAALLGWQAITARSDRLPSFAAVIVLARRWWPVRWAVLSGWGWVGWHLFVRTTS